MERIYIISQIYIEDNHTIFYPQRASKSLEEIEKALKGVLKWQYYTKSEESSNKEINMGQYFDKVMKAYDPRYDRWSYYGIHSIMEL